MDGLIFRVTTSIQRMHGRSMPIDTHASSSFRHSSTSHPPLETRTHTHASSIHPHTDTYTKVAACSKPLAHRIGPSGSPSSFSSPKKRCQWPPGSRACSCVPCNFCGSSRPLSSCLVRADRVRTHVFLMHTDRKGGRSIQSKRCISMFNDENRRRHVTTVIPCLDCNNAPPPQKKHTFSSADRRSTSVGSSSCAASIYCRHRKTKDTNTIAH